MSGKRDWLIGNVGYNVEAMCQAIKNNESEQIPKKSVLVYMMTKDRSGKEPMGVIPERRKSERKDNNAIGLLLLARKEFAKTEEEAQRIVIGDYV